MESFIYILFISSWFHINNAIFICTLVKNCVLNIITVTILVVL